MVLFADFSTVLTPAVSTEMTTLERVKLELDITDNASDALLRAFIGEASALIVRYIDRTLAEETLIDTFRPSGCTSADSLILSRWPVSAIASIVEDGTTLDAADYEFIDDVASEENRGEVWRLDSDGGRTVWSATPIVVQYTAGYSMVDELPPDLERAAIDLVKLRRFSSRRDPLVKSEDVPGVYSAAYWLGSLPGSSGGLPPDVAAALNPYRRMSV